VIIKTDEMRDSPVELEASHYSREIYSL